MKTSQIMEQPMAGRASMAVLGYRLYSYEVFTKVISKQNRALNGKDSSQIELCDWVRFFILQTSLIRSCLITLPSRTYPPFIALYGRFQVLLLLRNRSRFVYSLSDKMSSVQVPGAIVFMLASTSTSWLCPATQQSHPRCCVLGFSVFNCSLVLSCITSLELRGILDSSGARRLLLLHFFHIVVSARTCSSPALSLGWYCFIIIIIIIVIIIIIIIITIIFKAFKINKVEQIVQV